MFDLGHPDVVLSSSSAAVKNLYPPPGSVHVCYCHTPIRALWQEYGQTLTSEIRSLTMRRALTPVLWRLRMWDQAGSSRVNRFIANSQLTAARIRAYYGREAIVVHPPVDVERFAPSSGSGSYFLVVAQLVPYKRVDLAVQACTALSVPLRVVGTGPELARLQAMAAPTVQFLGRVGSEELSSLYSDSIALLFPGIEDFGLVPLEAMACGKPVIAYAGGGALETVIDGLTGLLVRAQAVEPFVDAISRTLRHPWAAADIRRHAERFGLQPFKDKISEIVDEALRRGPGYAWN
jgi:glycosyltransferase involved in cell wall biosynthesis